MIKTSISVILVVLLLCVPASYFFREHGAKLMDEGRSAASFPELPSKVSTHKLRDFFSSLDIFYADNFPLRNKLIKLTAPIHDFTKTDLDPKKCYRGIDNWLFLGNDYAHCVDKLEGTEPLSKAKLEKLLNKYTSIAKKCRDAGSQFAIIVGPNKSTIYPEFLPPTIIPAKTRYLTPLVDGLRKQGITIYDPTNDLWNAKKDGLLYWRTNTHWNARGGYIAFEGIRKIFNLPKLNISFDDGPLHSGDLVHIGGYKTGEFPIADGDNFRIQWNPEPQLTRNDEPYSTPKGPQGSYDGVSIVNKNATTEQTLWVFTDSFNAAMRPYFLASFRETACFKRTDFDTVMNSQRPKPDIILWVFVERDFI